MLLNIKIIVLGYLKFILKFHFDFFQVIPKLDLFIYYFLSLSVLRNIAAATKKPQILHWTYLTQHR